MKTATKKDHQVALLKIADRLLFCFDLLHRDWKKSSNFEALQAQFLKQAQLFRLVCSPYTCQTEPPLPEQVKMIEDALQHIENAADITLKWLQGPDYYSVEDYTASVIARAKTATKPAAVKPRAKKPITRTKRKR
jgi:hypothetical protein